MRLKEFAQQAMNNPNEYGQKVDPKQVREALTQKMQGFRSIGEELYSEQDYKRLAEQLSELCQLAEQAVLSESEDWFDNVTVKRNIKELKSYVQEFAKISRDAQSVKQRMTALYEDMGVIFNRYFDVPDEQIAQPPQQQQQQATPAPNAMQQQVKAGQMQEKKLTSAETSEKERLVKGMKPAKGEFEKRYPGRGEEVMYATATARAKENK